MANTTNWKEILEANREEIEAKMVEIYEAWEGKGTDIHEAVAIEPGGKLYTWEYAGNFSEPIECWNGTDFHITTFDAWSWTDCCDDWAEGGVAHARTEEEKTAISKRFTEEKAERKETGWSKAEADILREEFPEVCASIKAVVIDNEMDYYRGEVEEILDRIIENIYQGPRD